MKTAIVYSTVSKNTEKLAEVVKSMVGEVIHFGKANDEALNADVVYVGSWTQAFTCTPDIKAFLEKLNNKKVFVFMTAGYGSSDEYLKPILNSMKAHINDTNEIIGEFICQGKVSNTKIEAIKKMDMAKYETMKEELEKSQSHPNDEDLEKFKKLINI